MRSFGIALFILLFASAAFAQADDIVTLRHTRAYDGVAPIGAGSVRVACRLSAGIFSAAPPAVFNGRAYAATSDGSVVEVAGDSISRRYVSSGEIAATPAVSDRFVVVGSSAKFVEAFDRRSGRVLWKFKTKAAVKSSPLIVGAVIYVGGEDGFLYALDTLGKLRWKFNAKSPVASPSYDDGIVFVGTESGKCTALDAIKGKTIWASDAGGRTPVVGRELLYLVNRNGVVVALDKRTGVERWRYDIDSYPSVFDLAVSDSAMAYVAENVVVVLNPATGKRWVTTLPRPNCGAPMIVGGVVYIPNSDWKLHGFDAMSGKEAGQADIGFAPWGSPSFGDGKIFYPNKETLYTFSREE